MFRETLGQAERTDVVLSRGLEPMEEGWERGMWSPGGPDGEAGKEEETLMKGLEPPSKGGHRRDGGFRGSGLWGGAWSAVR